MLIRFISIFRPLLLTSSSMEIIFIPKNVIKEEHTVTQTKKKGYFENYLEETENPFT